MKIIGRTILIVVLSGLLISTLPSCGGGIAGIISLVRTVTKLVKLFKKPVQIAAANVESPDAQDDTGRDLTGGKTDKATLQIANLTDSTLNYWIDGESIVLTNYVIPAGESVIVVLDPGIYHVSQDRDDEIGVRDITLSAGEAYRTEVIKADAEYKQTLNNGVVVSEVRTGKEPEEKLKHEPPESVWGTIMVVNESDRAHPQYLNGEFVFDLPFDETRTTRVPPGGYVLSNTTDRENPDAAFIWFDVRTDETRTVRIRGGAG